MDGYARKGKHPLSMPQQTAHATPTRIASLGQSMVGSKVRVAGRILSYEPTTGLALLLDGEQGIIIDVSLCIDHNSSSWTRERLSLAMVVGYVETSMEVAIPTIPAHAPAPRVDAGVVVRAVLVTACADLDLDVWKAGIEEDGDNAQIAD
ncbi:hypothetical protein AX14_009016 [Amanita brunnescens Koide BX004]|nr:hypothetical protein AX14_009016 [Amanita brunnescens Koide BX004]